MGCYLIIIPFSHHFCVFVLFLSHNNNLAEDVVFHHMFSLWPLSASILTASVRAQDEKEDLRVKNSKFKAEQELF